MPISNSAAAAGVVRRLETIVRAIAGAALAALLSACANSGLLTRADYAPARAALANGNVAEAAVDLPRGEEGGFITTMEKTYLALLNGRPEIDALAKQAALLDSRVRYVVSREAKTFFYMQTPEDYYASEHEVIWAHLLLSWGYSLRGDAQNACVEARIAGSWLDLPYSPNGRFDDPALRVFLASLWAMCGSWEDAQVDLRAAAALDPSLVWARELAERDEPPANLFVVLGGIGPEPYWKPEMETNPLRGGRNIGFRFAGRRSPLEIVGRRGLRVSAHLSPGAAPWYARHLERDNEIHEIIKDSHYAKDIVLEGGVASAKIGAATAVGLAWGVGGVAVGAVLLRAAVEANSAEGAALAYSVAVGGIGKGVQTVRSGYRESTRTLEKRLDPSPGYRYVRFLPDYFWLAWTDAPIEYPVLLRLPDWQHGNLRPVRGTRPPVTIGFLPDVELYRASPPRYRGY